MPDRILRADILTSARVNSLSWPAEVFYRRLMSIADDYGRYEADAQLLRSFLYPKKIDKVSDSDVIKWLGEGSKAGLIRIYQVDNKDYLQIERFNQRLRAMRSKYPPPSQDDNVRHPPADDSIPRPETNRNDSESETNKGAPPAPSVIKKNEGKGFLKPTVEELKDYFVLKIGDTRKPKHWPEDKCSNQAELMHDHYETNGWVQNKGKPVKNWQAACRNWIRRALAGDFQQPTPAAKEKQVQQKPVREDPGPQLSKIQEELNFMYGTWLDNNDNITVISVTADHYNYLKTNHYIGFSDEEAIEIKRLAIGHMQLNKLEGDNFMVSLMKKYGVLEFFKQLQKQDKDTVFVS